MNITHIDLNHAIDIIYVLSQVPRLEDQGAIDADAPG